MTEALKKWLNTPCDESDLLELTKGVFYIPIGIVKKKILYMREKFNVDVFQKNFHHFMFTDAQRVTYASGSKEVIIYQDKQLINELVGAATFPTGNYGENTHYAATLSSLCLVSALAGEYPQFGSHLNKTFDVVAPLTGSLAKVPTDEVDKEIEKLFKGVKTKLSKFSCQEDAQAYLDTTEFRFNIECKDIIKKLPLKKK